MPTVYSAKLYYLRYHGGTTSMQSHLMNHHPDKYVYMSGKDSKNQRKIDSFMQLFDIQSLTLSHPQHFQGSFSASGAIKCTLISVPLGCWGSNFSRS